MSELKAHNINDLSLHDIANCDFYLKSEADKVIAELEESHKKEVGQLLMKITFNGVKLEGFKKEVTNAVDKSNA